MSDEESFVILDSSADPLLNSEYSLAHDGIASSSNTVKSLNTDIDDIKVSKIKTSTTSTEDSLNETVKSDTYKTTATSNVENIDTKTSVMSNASNSKSNLGRSLDTSMNGKPLSLNGSNSGGEEPSLASSFLLGEVHADVLKNSVYSQFPSLCSMEACAEDVVKLQNLLTEYGDLKQTLFKVNNTMKQYYELTRKWREEALKQEQEYQKTIAECQQEIEKLRKENQALRDDVEHNKAHINITEELRQKDHEELILQISEKSALINNMRVEIDKLNQQQLQSYEFVPGKSNNEKPLSECVDREEHNREIKELKREMSTLLAKNLDLEDRQKLYIDEINCLKVNLTSAEELLFQRDADIRQLQNSSTEHAEEIALLREQVAIYRKDFEVERAERNKNAGEKEQYLLDLRSLQRRNQELIEALAEANKANRTAATISSVQSQPYTASLRENQRPVRVLDPTGAAARTASPEKYIQICPVCGKTFASLVVLQAHVNDCLDTN